MSEKTIYGLDLHEEIKVGDNLWVRRVPGGWLYSDTGMSDAGQCIFVPLNNEYQPLFCESGCEIGRAHV